MIGCRRAGRGDLDTIMAARRLTRPITGTHTMTCKFSRAAWLTSAAAVTLIFASLALPAAGFAQSAGDAKTDDKAQPKQVEEIIVTGSRIPVAGFDTLQPAQTVSADSIVSQGYSNVGQALDTLPGFGVAGNNNTGQQSAAQVGEQFVNLYNLGAQRTLVLVDGRRYVSGNAPVPVGTFGGAAPGQEVDLNDIPVALIDHVEVVSVGGAPIYGADAIAGTVNIILKKNYQGVSLETQYGQTRYNDGKTYTGRFLAGTNFADGKGNITLAVEYNQQDGLTLANRPDTLPYETQQAPLPGSAGCGYNECLVSHATVASIFPGGIPDTGPGVANSGSPTYPTAIHNAAGQVVAFAPNGTLVPVNLGIQNNGVVFAQGGDGDNLAYQNSFIAPYKRYNTASTMHYDFTDHIEGYLEAEFSHNQGTQIAAQPSYQSAFFASDNGEGPIKFSLTNPYLTSQALSILEANPTVAQSGSFYLSRADLDLAPQSVSDVTNVYRVVAGFKGDFDVLGRNWKWDANFNYGSTAESERYYQINEANFLNAIDVVKNPATGQIECAVTANPPPLPSTGIQPTSVTGCQPLDLFGQGAPSAAAANFVTAQDLALAGLTERDAQINLTGSPFDDWAGKVEFATGFEFRQESGSYNVDAFANSGLGRNPPVSDVAGGYNTKEFYAESTIPVISAKNNIPFVTDLEFNGAYRYIDNSYAGGANVYTLGGKFKPIGDIEFRGNFTHSVRAPSIEELFLPTTSTNSFADDPCDPNFITSGSAPANRAANCAKAFAALPGAPALAVFKSNVVNASVLGTTGGNPNLQNEVANSWTAGVVLRPHWVPHFQLAVDWINISLENAITALSLTNVMDACYDAPGSSFPNQFCSLFTRNAQGQVSSYSTPLENIQGSTFAGLQVQSTYFMDVNDLPLIHKISFFKGDKDRGHLSFNWGGFFTETQANTILGISTPTVGNIGDPVWKMNGSVTWAYQKWSVFLQGDYVGPGFQNVTLQRSAEQLEHTGAYWEWNTAISYDITQNLKATLTVDNLFNQNPPPNSYLLGGQAALATYDYLGQRFYVTLRAKF
jgi:outer membrane receptor protein involved in Fe transport